MYLRDSEKILQKEFRSILRQNYQITSSEFDSNSNSDSNDQISSTIQQKFDRKTNENKNQRKFNFSKEYYLISMIYLGKNNHQLEIYENDQLIFKGCLLYKDLFKFKSKIQSDVTDYKLNWKFYLNNQLTNELISCCQYSLIEKNQIDFIQIKRIDGENMCTQCHSNRSKIQQQEKQNDVPQSKSKEKSEKASSNCHQEKESMKTKILRTSPTDQILSNQQTIESKDNTTERQDINEQRLNSENEFESKQTFQSESNRVISIEHSVNEDFQVNSKKSSQTEENSLEDKSSTNVHSITQDNLSTTLTQSITNQTKRIYGPPQLSAMLSFHDGFDPLLETSIDTNHSFQFGQVEQQSQFPRSQEFEGDSKDENNSLKESSIDSQHLNSQNRSAEQENNSNNDENSLRLSSNRLLNQEATQFLLSQLGIIRQQQIERSTNQKFDFSPREKGNLEYFSLIYLNEKSLEIDEIKYLRSLINYFKIFNDIDDCLAFINNIVNEKILIITSIDYAEKIISKTKDLQQIYSFYLLNENSTEEFHYFEPNWKIRGVFTNLNEIYQMMFNDIELIKCDLIGYSTFNLNTNSIDKTFIYFEILNEILLDTDETELALKELIHFAREEYKDNEHELNLIDEFECDYQPERAIWWFTRPCFLSKILNKALRIPDIDVLFRFRKFIQDLHRQIQNQSIENQSIIVYLAQTIHQTDLDDLMKYIHEPIIISFNQFLFGTTDYLKSKEKAENLPRLSDDYLPLIIHFDLTTNTKSVNQSSLRFVSDENNDILLDFCLRGRIVQIERNIYDQQKLISIHLKSLDEKDEISFKRSLQIARSEIISNSPLISLIKLMFQLNHNTRAKHFIEDLFNDQTIQSDANLQGSIAACCHLIGSTCHSNNDYKQAIQFFQLSLSAFRRFMSEDSVQLSPTYNNIGSMYFRQEQYDQALEYHEKALTIQLNSQTPNLNSIAAYSNNIGVVYLKKEKYSDAIKSFNRALKILLEIQNCDFTDLASTYDNLGDAFLLQDHYEQALNHYLRAVEYQNRVEKRNPQAFASYHNSIGNVYHKLNRYHDALIYFKRALEYQQEFLPISHPSFASLFNNIGSMYYRQDLFNEALPYYLRSLEIELMTLPDTHPTIAVTHFNIATSYTGLGRFDEAIASVKKSVEQLLKTLPENHPEVIENRSYIQIIERKKKLKELLSSS